MIVHLKSIVYGLQREINCRIEHKWEKEMNAEFELGIDYVWEMQNEECNKHNKIFKEDSL